MAIIGNTNVNISTEQPKLSPPWEIYRSKIAALFRNDPEIYVSTIADNKIIIETRNIDKYEALTKILPSTMRFGNYLLKIDIKIPNENSRSNPYDLMVNLFNGNDSVEDVITKFDPMGNQQIYVVFKPEVMQFFSDNIRDYNGITTTLGEAIAREIFSGPANDVNFCTGKSKYEYLWEKIPD